MLIRVIAAFVVLPGLFAFVIPVLIAAVDPWAAPFFSPGVLLLGVGILVLVWCVRDFYVAGKGTLTPWSPPERLVVVGLYRFVRNPMYIGVVLVVLGWSLFFCSPMITGYAVVLFVGFHVRVVFFEEPWLREHFGSSWEEYREHVSRWRLRWTAWKGTGA